MKKTIHILLVVAAIVPVVLLFWPFAEWNNAMSIILRVIPSMAVQVLFCRICRSDIVKTIPALLAGSFALWGTYLFFTSPHWINATVGDLIADYVSPFICCVFALAAHLSAKNTPKEVF